jgi:uncharacterized membrane protein
MAELLCLAFERTDAADNALHELRMLPEGHSAELIDACVVKRNPAGGMHVKQLVNLMVGGATGGSVLGAACGCLAGSVLIDPSTGSLLGAALGAATGAVCGALSDYGIDDRFIAETAGAIAPGGSALFVLLRPASVENLLAQLQAHHPTLLHTSMKRIADGRKDADHPAAARSGDSARPGGARRNGDRSGARVAAEAGRSADAHARRPGIGRLHHHHV